MIWVVICVTRQRATGQSYGREVTYGVTFLIGDPGPLAGVATYVQQQYMCFRFSTVSSSPTVKESSMPWKYQYELVTLRPRGLNDIFVSIF